ncbi:hypothetical protein ACRWQL_16450 [Shewanella sp. HL-SH4]|uniref:hypothetical protein n=1 Tax=Shewanella sp. HL-SH4 TaxID=3436240 RepID=UPI003EBBEB89
MKLIVKVVISTFVIACFAYYGSLFVMPSVTIENHSTSAIKQIEVALPSSNLNFGAINDGEKNTLYYSLEQNDGMYRYQFENENSAVYNGSCGYVTSNELHKRFIITINKNNQVICR